MKRDSRYIHAYILYIGIEGGRKDPALVPSGGVKELERRELRGKFGESERTRRPSRLEAPSNLAEFAYGPLDRSKK